MKTHISISLPFAVLVCFFAAVAVEDDVLGLEGIKTSLTDPKGVLSLWSFTNISVNNICTLNGIGFFNFNETRVMSIQLSSSGLSGNIPESLQNCHSLQTLDLSSNSLGGTIPMQICDWLPYLVKLDLSNNELSGSITTDIVKCNFLNDLVLSNNKLSGQIPYEVARLARLKNFSVADNALSGSIPAEIAKFGSDSFRGNHLCGKPLGSCGGLSKKSLAVIIAAGISGAVGGMLLGFGLLWSRR